MEGQIVVSGLTKQYPKVRAVDDLSFTVEPGRVTGFLGPNGSGKTTTLRMMLNLVTPTKGTATIGGARYADLARTAGHRRRGAGGVERPQGPYRPQPPAGRLRRRRLPDERADEVLDLVGLTPAAKRKFKGYSLGMRQRLGIAAAMLGDPRVLILDEPANGLDPEGIRWMREFLRAFAAQGRTVFVSSHLLSEMEQLADDVIIIAAGKLIAQGRVDRDRRRHVARRHGPGPHAARRGAHQRAAQGRRRRQRQRQRRAQVSGRRRAHRGPGGARRAGRAARAGRREARPRARVPGADPGKGGHPMTTATDRTGPHRRRRRCARRGAAVRLIRAELLKIWTTNTWWIFGIIALVDHRARPADQRASRRTTRSSPRGSRNPAGLRRGRPARRGRPTPEEIKRDGSSSTAHRSTWVASSSPAPRTSTRRASSSACCSWSSSAR